MFKISMIDTRNKRRLVVEGKLMAPWANELLASWKSACLNLDGRKLVIDLSSVTVISRDGEDAIFSLMKDGAKFSCCGVLTRYVLKCLARRCPGKPGDDEKPNLLHE
jgi:anti-anti-sigma regulatory factor